MSEKKRVNLKCLFKCGLPPLNDLVTSMKILIDSTEFLSCLCNEIFVNVRSQNIMLLSSQITDFFKQIYNAVLSTF